MKKIIATLILGGLFAASSNADVNIHITGSTAFRANTYRAIRSLYGANLVSQNPADPASSKNQVTWTGTMPAIFGSNQTVNVFASYSGSIAGVQALAQSASVTFLAYPTNGTTNTFTAPADLAFSDVFQASTPYTTPALDDAIVAVQPFVYVKSSASGSVSNVTMQQMQTMLANGFAELSYFTGKTNDDNSLIYMVGRTIDSGTRLTALADDFFTGSPQLYQLGSNCSTWVLSSGFSSGSGVVGQLTGSCSPAIGYLGLSDAESATANATNPATILTYNGYYPFASGNYTPGGTVTNQPDFSPVYKGLYSYWSYEHLFRLTGANANVDALRSNLVSAINVDITNAAVIGNITAIQTNAMKVSRPSDGGPINP